jgi:hypothetical protein
MDPQTIQALMGVFQQGLQILQQAQSGGAAPAAMGAPGAGAPPPPGGDPGAAPGGPPGAPPMGDGDGDEGDDDMYGDDAGNPGGFGDDAAEDGMGTGQSLHDRVSQVERHTGLKKSANGSLSDRIADLEIDILGTEYEGPMIERVGQLEKAAGVSPAKPKPASAAPAAAPDEIPLDTLIKSAIQQGIKEGLAAIAASADSQENGDDDIDPDVIPDLRSMRKAANSNGKGRYGRRRGAAPISQSDEDLVKSAAHYGWGESDLDEEFTLGDALQMQYNAQQSGEAIPFADDDDD